MLKWIEKYIFWVEFAIHKKMMVRKIKVYQSYFSAQVLDVGAGDKPYAKLFPQVSKYIATNTKSHYKNTNDVVSYTDIWIDDASSIPVNDNDFEGVLCFQVLSVIAQPDLFFKEAARILKPGGKLLLTTDFLYPPWSKEDNARYSIQQLERFVEQAGLKPLKKESFGGFKSMQFSLLSRRIRSYPQRIKQAPHIWSKAYRGAIFLFYLLFLPMISLAGYLIYLMDKKVYDDFDFTFNLLILAEKPLDK
ncbi:MAG: hypothetical protein B7C24_15425 [Bacteroidetes bacterium 4572_77]|nr:MAG: hypothetical protein B7C24_15425 [Bacteroidetes bacterium 4572_77]